LRIFRKSIEKILVSLKSENNNGYFTLRPTYLRDNVSTNSSKNDKFFGQKLYRKSKRTLYIEDLFPENRAVYGVMWKKKTVQPDWPQMTIWRKGIVPCIPKATDTQSEYVINIACPLQQWFQEHTSLLHYTFIACPVTSIKKMNPCLRHEGVWGGV